jgi:hypothetical protein
MENIIEKMFNRCFEDKKWKQAIGVALVLSDIECVTKIVFDLVLAFFDGILYFIESS